MKTIPRNLIEDKTYCVNYIVYLNDESVREFVYIAVRKDRMAEFQQAVEHGNFDTEDYGVVLEHGTGEPSDHVKSTMKMLYKCNHDSGISLVDYQAEKNG
jgi:hypothetical protein